MAVEIEKFFMVQGEFRKSAKKMVEITKWYLSLDPESVFRVRMQDDKDFFLAKKGISDECKISKKEADALLRDYVAKMIVKTRYLVPFGNHTFEVDVFHGDNDGLIVAKIKLTSGDESFVIPRWLGRPIIGEIKYYDSSLIEHPYSLWTDKEKVGK